MATSFQHLRCRTEGDILIASIIPTHVQGDELAEALRRVIAEPATAARMGDEGRRRVGELFSAARWSERLQALYEEVARG